MGVSASGKSHFAGWLLFEMDKLMRWDKAILICPQETYTHTPAYLQIFSEAQCYFVDSDRWKDNLDEMMTGIKATYKLVNLRVCYSSTPSEAQPDTTSCFLISPKT